MIDGYRNGEITYGTRYTIVWAGKIVDRADTYAEFTSDRNERLDRYQKEYGEGWIFWESPLQVANNGPHLSRCADLIRNTVQSGFGGYDIIQTYWKRAGWVRRMPIEFSMDFPVEHSQSFLTSDNGMVYCQSEGPKVNFKTILDSGMSQVNIV